MRDRKHTSVGLVRGPIPHPTPTIGVLFVRPPRGSGRWGALTCLLRLLTLLLAICPALIPGGSFDAASSPPEVAVVLSSSVSASDETPQLTRLGNEVDDLREAVAGPMPRIAALTRTSTAFAPRRIDHVGKQGDHPPDRPPRSAG